MKEGGRVKVEAFHSVSKKQEIQESQSRCSGQKKKKERKDRDMAFRAKLTAREIKKQPNVRSSLREDSPRRQKNRLVSTRTTSAREPPDTAKKQIRVNSRGDKKVKGR